MWMKQYWENGKDIGGNCRFSFYREIDVVHKLGCAILCIWLFFMWMKQYWENGKDIGNCRFSFYREIDVHKLGCAILSLHPVKTIFALYWLHNPFLLTKLYIPLCDVVYFVKPFPRNLGRNHFYGRIICVIS